MSDIRVNVDTREIEGPVPRGSKVLLVQLPAGTERRLFDHFADAIRMRTLDHWRDHPNEPAILVVSDDVTVRWLEAEAPEPAKRALPKQRRPMTTVTKGLGPERVRKG